jgi:hypothetical protein
MARGAMKLIHRPSGDNWPPILAGLPNSLVRSISGPSAAAAGCATITVAPAARTVLERHVMLPVHELYCQSMTAAIGSDKPEIGTPRHGRTFYPPVETVRWNRFSL